MLRRIAQWFNIRKAKEADTPEVISAEAKNEFMLDFATTKLSEWLGANAGASYALQVEAYMIQNWRACAEVLPMRVYVYDLSSPLGELSFKDARMSQRSAQDVFECDITVFRGRKFGFYLYRVEGVGDPQLRQLDVRKI